MRRPPHPLASAQTHCQVGPPPLHAASAGASHPPPVLQARDQFELQPTPAAVSWFYELDTAPISRGSRPCLAGAPAAVLQPAAVISVDKRSRCSLMRSLALRSIARRVSGKELRACIGMHSILAFEFWSSSPNRHERAYFFFLLANPQAPLTITSLPTSLSADGMTSPCTLGSGSTRAWLYDQEGLPTLSGERCCCRQWCSRCERLSFGHVC